MLTTSMLLAAAVVAAGLYVAAAFNRLVALDRRCDQADADIDVQLKLRRDLVPGLVETVKGYAGHEREALEAVTKARTAAASAASGPERMQAEQMLGSALGRLMLVVEAYPDLKASTGFLQLQAELTDIENKIAAARRFLNAASTEYNTTRHQFPGNVVGDLFEFKSRQMTIVPADARAQIETAPAVRF